jgi:two-component system osmolarity sensor histidine kinase EnvZ
MRFVPRTLFGRNLLLMAALILFAEIAMALIFRQTVQEPRIGRLIEFAQTHTHAIRAALAEMNPEQRTRYLAELARENTTRIATGAPPARLAAEQRPLVRMFLNRLGRRLGSEYQLAWENAPERRLWIGTVIGEQRYWFGLDAAPFLGNIAPLFAAFALGAGGLALLGAYLIQRRINRPLRALALAAAGVGRGERELPPLEKNAPEEIAQVDASFRRMAASLEAAERERALMLAGVSHDLRTPLAKLRLATEILAPQADPDLIESMVHNIAAADGVIDQFIAYARIGSDEALHTCDLNEMARDVAKTAGAPIHLQLKPLPAVDCRPVALRRALANLVENALRHGNGGVELRSSQQGGRIMLGVFDSGPGIPPGELERIRQPFTRLGSARGGKPGAGLGLAIVERIARLHRGELILRNRPEGGLEATLDLPAGQAAEML